MKDDLSNADGHALLDSPIDFAEFYPPVRIDGDSTAWRFRRLDMDRVRETRRSFHPSGSCSFAEPTTEMTEWRSARAAA